MLHSRFIVVVYALLLTLAQTSCVESEHPLVDPEKCKIDERLVGTWKMIKPEGDKDVVIRKPLAKEIKNCPEGLLVVTKNDDAAWPSYWFVAKIGKDDYIQRLSSFLTNDKHQLAEWNQKEIGAYEFAKYTVVGGRLTLLVTDHQAATSAVQAGKLEGMIGSGMGRKVYLSESTEGLRKYLEAGGNMTLFDMNKCLKFTLDRVKE